LQKRDLPRGETVAVSTMCSLHAEMRGTLANTASNGENSDVRAVLHNSSRLRCGKVAHGTPIRGTPTQCCGSSTPRNYARKPTGAPNTRVQSDRLLRARSSRFWRFLMRRASAAADAQAVGPQ
jgi:hypothetical protein